MFDFLLSSDLWVAALTGGVLVKLIDYILPSIINSRSRKTEFLVGEKDALKKDIDYLRGEIETMRKELNSLRSEVRESSREASAWQKRYWQKKIVLDKVAWEVRHFGNDDVRERVFDTLDVNGDEPSVNAQQV